MPGDEAAYPPIVDLYPQDADEHQQLVSWANQAFIAAETHRQNYENRWLRYHKLSRNYIKREKGDWRSKVFLPHIFSTIETIAPKMLAQLPDFVCMPIGPEDITTARHMQELLNWAKEHPSVGLFEQMTASIKSALKYGTGILKTYHLREVNTAYRMAPNVQPVMATVEEPVTDDQGRPVTDPDGNQVFDSREVEMGYEQLAPSLQPYEYVAYDGPAAECVDIFNFYPAPEATSIDSARYVIQRVWREMSDVLRHVESGDYHLPPDMSPTDVATVEDEPLARRLASLELGGDTNDPTRRPVELLEFWTKDGRVITMANRKAILRVAQNPFNHSRKPYVRVVDFYQEHEFWGVGEAELLEGLQDLQNAIVNQRVDNVRLNMNGMWAVDKDAVLDLRDLKSRPGGVVQVNGPVRDAIDRIDPGDVTSGAFAEAAEGERLIEKFSGVTAYQAGLDSPSLNDTATGAALITEQGNTKFAMKLRLMEEMAFKELARQWGSIFQQFTSAERIVRMLGPEGQWFFLTFDPESIQGALDYTITAASSAQTDSVRKQQDMTLLQLLAGVWPYAVPQLVIDVLRDFNKKDLAAYMGGPQASQVPDPLTQALMDAQGAAPPDTEQPYQALPSVLEEAQLQTRLQPRFPQQ